MKDDEKKFIQKSIDDALDKKFTEQDKKQEASLKNNAVLMQKMNLEQQKLLEELQQKDQQAQNTLAEKIELLKLSIDQNKQITNKKSTNPILNIFYGNKQKETKAEEADTENKQGAAGLLQAAKSTEEDEQQVTDKKDTVKLTEKPFISPQFEESNAQIILEEKDDWKEKIDTIYNIVTQEQKENVKQSNTLSKGLKGLTSSMSSIKDFTNLLVAKQKLILGVVGLGAFGILALVSWFKSGGLQKTLNKAISKAEDELLNKLASDQGKQKRKEADDYVEKELNNIKTDATNTQNMITDMNLNKEADFSKTTYLSDPSKGDYETNQRRGRTNDLKNTFINEGVNEKDASNMANVTYYGTVAAKATKSDAKKSTTLKLPFEVGVRVWKDMQDKKHCIIELQRVAKKRSDSVKSVYVSNAVKSSVKTGKVAANQAIAVLDPGFRIIGDWDAFLGVNEKTSIEDSIYNDRSEEIAKTANEKMNEAYKNSGVPGADLAAREADKRLGVFKDYTQDNLKQTKSKPEIQTETTPPTQEKPEFTSKSVNPDKVTTQNTQLNNPPETKQPEQVAQAPQNQPATTTVIQQPANNNNATGVRYADTGLSSSEYISMCPTFIDTNGVDPND